MDTFVPVSDILIDPQEVWRSGLRKVSLSQICPITYPGRQDSSLILETKQLLREHFGDDFFLRGAPAKDLTPDEISAINLMRYQTFRIFKGWMIPNPDWTEIDLHPETHHHLLYNSNGQLVASARTSQAKIFPSLNGHSPFDIGHMTAFTGLNSGSEPNLSVIDKFRQEYPIPNQGLTIGTIERLTLAPIALPFLTPRQLIGANMLLLSPIALDAFDRLLTSDINIIQADDAMTKLFTGAYGPEIREVLKTTQKRHRALIDGISQDGPDMIDDPCHTLVFRGKQLMSSVREYNPVMYYSFVTRQTL